MTQIKLTDRQAECLEIVVESIRSRGMPPTLRELCAAMGISSTNGANDHLKALERKGYIERDDLKSRGIRVVGLNLRQMGGEMVEMFSCAGESMCRVAVDRLSLGVNDEHHLFAILMRPNDVYYVLRLPEPPSARCRMVYRRSDGGFRVSDVPMEEAQFAGIVVAKLHQYNWPKHVIQDLGGPDHKRETDA